MTDSLGISSATDYSGSYIYRNNALQFISQPEGYIEPNGQGGYDYGYRLKDHLGNIRLTFIDFDHNGSIALSEITEENNYYPFGLKHQNYNDDYSSNRNAVAAKFKYNGKELNDELGLDLYDYGARFYDPAIGRWHVIDNKAEKYYSYTPYTYAANNPIRYIDPDGNKIVDATGGVIYTQKGGWSKNASAGAMRIGNAMMATPAGLEQFSKLSNVSYNVTLTLDPGKGDGTKMASCSNSYDGDKQVGADIVVYGGNAKDLLTSLETAREQLDKGEKFVKEPAADTKARLDNMPKTVDEIIGQEGAHESVHALEKGSQAKYESNYEKREAAPRQKEIETIIQTPVYRLEKLESKKTVING